MKKLESSLKNMLLVLTGVTVVAVGLLAYVNELTKGPIAEANLKSLNEALKKVVPQFTNNPVAESDTVFTEKDGKKIVNFIIYPARNEGALVGTAVESSSMGFGGELKVLVGFDNEGNILNYSLLSHAETPGLGSKADEWFKEGNKGSIIGINPGATPLGVKDKDMDGQVESITASTITTRAFLNAVNAAYRSYMGETDVVSGATQQTDSNSAATAQADSTSATKQTETNNNAGAIPSDSNN